MIWLKFVDFKMFGVCLCTCIQAGVSACMCLCVDGIQEKD